MFTRILVPLDGTSLSEQAVPFARSIAKAYGASVVLASVVTASPTATTVAEPLGSRPMAWAGQVAPMPEDVDRLKDAVRADIEHTTGYLERHAMALRGDQVPSVDTRVMRGDPSSGLQSLVEEEAIDLIVAATHGRSGVARTVLGSITDELVRQAPCPVLALSPNED